MPNNQFMLKPLHVWVALNSILLVGALYMALVYAPTEAIMGDVQRIFYFHVGAAWAGALGFLLASVMSIAFLATRQLRWDRLAASSVEVSLALLTMALASGMIWAKWTWGTYWPSWDPKLRSVAVVWLVYAAYLMLRQAFASRNNQALFSSVYGIVAVLTVLFAFVGVRIINTAIHPVVLGASAANQSIGLTPKMLHTLIAATLALTMTYITLLIYRARLAALKDALTRKLKNTAV